MARDVRIAILGDSRDFSRAARNASSDADRLGRDLNKAGGHFQKFTKSLAFGAGAVLVAGAALGKGFVDAAIESQKVTKQTEAVIKSMGGASKVTAKEVAKLSQKLSLKTGVDDELIQSGENLLLTFGKIRNEVGKDNKIFDRATQAALDMSVAMGTDMKGAAVQVGKALNDPIKGITALTRVGVSFTQQQKDQIKALVESGDVLGAQKIILAELERQFGGSAEAQATAVDKLKVAWGNLQEELGAQLLPVVEAVAAWLSEHLPGAMETLNDWIENTLKPALEGAKESFEANILPAMGAVASFVVDTLVPNLATFIDWIANSKPALTTLGTIVGTYLVGAFIAYAVAAGQAAVATVIATWPVWLAVAAVAALTAGLYALTHNEGEGFIDWLKRMGAYALLAGQIVANFFRTLWSWARIAWGAVWGVIDAVNTLIGRIKDLASIAGKLNPIDLSPGGLNIPGVPWFDSGGVMPGPIGRHSLAMVAGGETILPTHKRGIAVEHSTTAAAFPSSLTLVVDGQRFSARIVADGQRDISNRGFAA